MSDAELLRQLDWRPGADRRPLPDDEVDWLRELGGPTLIRVPGREPGRPRVAATLLHGNEPSGLRALHRWLRADPRPAVDAILFVGAVQTALGPPPFAQRVRPGGRDFNRCWLPPHAGLEGRVARRVLAALREAGPECLVDLHNNTGQNPAYGVAPRIGERELALVSLFAERIVHTPISLATLAEATSELFPSVVVECGRSGDPAADEAAYAGLRRYLERPTLEATGARSGMQVLGDPVRVCVSPGVDLEFGDAAREGAGFTMSRDIDRHNFEILKAGTPLGWVADDSPWPVEAWCRDGIERSREFFAIEAGALLSRTDFVPVMMTTNREIALSDCLFYATQPAKSD